MGTLRDSSGNPVKSGSGENIKTRYDDDEDKAKAKAKSKQVDDVQDYASLGRRAGATSPFGGPKEYINEDKRAEKETDSTSTGVFSNFRAEAPEPANAVETSAPASVKKAMKVVEKAAPAAESKPAPSKMKSAKETMEKGRAGAVESEKKPKSKDEEKYGKSKRLKALVETFTGRDSEKSSDSGSSSKASDTGKSERLKAISDTFKRAGQSYDNPFAKKYKSGGSVSSASKRADGIAQKGKTRGRMV